MIAVKQVDSARCGWLAGAYRRLRPAIGMGVVLLLSLQERAVAQSDSRSDAQSAALKAADQLDEQGAEYYQQAEYDKALTLHQKALQIRRSALGAQHPKCAESLNNLAVLHYLKGDYERAWPLLAQALVIKEKALGKDHPSVAMSLNNLALIHYIKGDYERALPLYERALTIREKTLGQHHPHVAMSLNNLAMLYHAQGAYERVLPYLERSLAIWEQAPGEHDAAIATALNNLAGLYRIKGDYEHALSLLQRSLVMAENALGAHHPEVARTLNNLARLYHDKGNYERALPLWKRALAIWQDNLGEHHPHVATSLNNLAEVYYTKGDYERALQLLTRSLDIKEKALGQHHPSVAVSLNNLAWLHRAKGEYARALTLHERTLAIMEQARGKQHPDVAKFLYNLATFHWAQGNNRKAVIYLQQAMDAKEAHIRLIGAGDLSRAKRLLLAQYSSDIDAVISFAVHDGQPAAKRLALTTLLRRKGRVSDAMSNAFAAARGRLGPYEQNLLDTYRSNRTIYARLLLRGPGRSSRAQHQQNLKQLQQRAHDMERLIAERSQEFGSQLRPVTIDAVQSALPARAVLVEWMRYRTYDPGATGTQALGAERYAASILARAGDPVWIDLGAADVIDTAIKKWRVALARRLITADARARQLDALVMAPVRAHLGTVTKVFLSPDGPLNLIPFAALVDERGQHLVERYLFTYLTSGRDLLRIENYRDATAQSPTLIVADPQYDVPGAPAVWAMEPLPNVMVEARAVQAVFPDAILLTGDQATEQALKGARGPAVLHLATHGYFAPTTCGEADAEVDDPSLQSGVALAGANACRSPGHGRDDGLLTALETASLDLYGTELAVLSACDTGVGGTELHDHFLDQNIGRGDGVQGLRRALVLAGAKTHMVSLWPVDNITTRKLMVAYYGKLAEGQGRSQALRAVQRELMRDKELAHPNAWAAFIVSGESGPLNLPMTKPHLGTIRGPRGCACDVLATAPRPWPGIVFLALLTLGLLCGLRRGYF